MLRAFIEFWTLHDPNVFWVLCGSVLLGAGAGVIGCFAFLRKRALAGDALAHAALPGVTSAFLVFQSREPVVILGGALISCAISFLAIDYLARRTKIKEDSALAIVLSFFFALGIYQLTYIQRLSSGGQAGLDKLLFGQAASLVEKDVYLLGGIAFGILLFVVFFFEQLKLISFDRNYARALGLNIKLYDSLLALAIVLSVVIGLQLVGVVLMAAMLLTPAAAARYWSNDLKVMLVLAGLFGAASGIFGANVSYLIPRMPTGPWMVVGITAIFAVSVTFAPRRGILWRLREQSLTKKRVTDENILRTFYKLGEDKGAAIADVSSAELLTHRKLELPDLGHSLNRLIAAKQIEQCGQTFQLTAQGFGRAEELTRRHRLWEVYISKEAQIPTEAAHADAEEVEHILTPELEGQLEAEVGQSRLDPHGKVIPKPPAAAGEKE